MAYYLGRDLDFALTTEHTSYGLVAYTKPGDPGAVVMDYKTWADGAAAAYSMHADNVSQIFAGPKRQVSTTVFGSLVENIDPSDAGAYNLTWDNRPDNITGVDLSVSTQDEDVQFIGQRNVLKAEIKKENSITITRKKKDSVWNAAYDQARFGFDEDGNIGNGHYQPDFTTYGYRVYLKFGTGTGGETLVLPNCCITDYSVSLSPDSSQEESITLMSYTNPWILDGVNNENQIADATGGL